MLSVHVHDRILSRRHSARYQKTSWPQLRSAVLVVLAASVIGCGGSPDVMSEAGLKSLDALYTAVTSRKPELVDHCAAQVARLETSGDLSSSAADVLEDVIKLAKTGEWQQSAEYLDKYIRLQTRR